MNRNSLAEGEKRGSESNRLISFSLRIRRGYRLLVLKTYIIARQAPSMVLRIEGIFKRKDTPNQRVIKPGGSCSASDSVRSYEAEVWRFFCTNAHANMI